MEIINNINISGPINIVRLEGEIGKEKKVLYLFFDVHVRDTKCKDYDSLDIVQLFNKFINESKSYKNEWDLFIEHDVNIKNIKEVIDKSYFFGGNYLQDLRSFFNNKFTEDINSKIRIRNNIRYHFFDIRMMYNIYDIDNLLNELINYNYNNSILYDKVSVIKNLIKKSYDLIFKMDKKLNKKYSDKKVKKIILEILKEYDNEFKNLMKEFEKIKNNINKSKNVLFFQELNKDGYYSFDLEIKNKLNTFRQKYIDVNFKITDLYFLRRYLDKKYIKNGVIYSGASHSLHIILKLVKLFNFKITNVSYSDIKLEKLNKLIKKANSYRDFETNLMPKYLIQCSSMKNFPDMFL